jgi:hypothetical protein
MSSRPTLGPTQSSIQWVAEFFPSGVKWQGRDADHPSPTSAEVKKTCMYTSSPQYVFMA